jgi:hypothetical protein
VELVAGYLALGVVFCAAGVLYPFPPFRKRWRAVVAGLATFTAMVLAMPPESPEKAAQRAAERQDRAATAAAVAPAAPAPRRSDEAPTIRERDQRTPASRRVPVPTDTRATYHAIEIAPSPIGRVIITQRDGPSGRSFVRRECTCPVGQYRVLGDSQTAVGVMRDRPEEPLAALVYDRVSKMGSVSWHVCDFACRAAL